MRNLSRYPEELKQLDQIARLPCQSFRSALAHFGHEVLGNPSIEFLRFCPGYRSDQLRLALKRTFTSAPSQRSNKLLKSLNTTSFMADLQLVEAQNDGHVLSKNDLCTKFRLSLLFCMKQISYITCIISFTTRCKLLSELRSCILKDEMFRKSSNRSSTSRPGGIIDKHNCVSA